MQKEFEVQIWWGPHHWTVELGEMPQLQAEKIEAQMNAAVKDLRGDAYAKLFAFEWRAEGESQTMSGMEMATA